MQNVFDDVRPQFVVELCVDLRGRFEKLEPNRQNDVDVGDIVRIEDALRGVPDNGELIGQFFGQLRELCALSTASMPRE